MPTVSIKHQDLSLTVAENSNLLSALEEQNVIIPSSCLAGSCGTCRIKINEGNNNLNPPSDFELAIIKALKVNYQRIHGPDYMQESDIRLACQLKVNGDIVIELI